MEQKEMKNEMKKVDKAKREYFILVKDTGETFTHGLDSEKDARTFICKNGDYDIEYIIGYTITYLKPVIKTAKVVLK